MNQKDIKFLIMDVDGTLTDGKIYMGSGGELFKAFDIKDGLGICRILPEHGITPVVITARNSKIVEQRCKELGIRDVYQGIHNKIGKLEELLELKSAEIGTRHSLQNTAYIGDDIIDLQCMIQVKEAGGITGCPKDAVKEVLDICDFVSTKNGGCGAVREFIDWIVDIADTKERKNVR